MEKVIFFDLEETLIKEFNSSGQCTFLNNEKIKNWLRGQGNFSSGLLSFALDNKNLNNFNDNLRNELEVNINITFDDKFIFTIDDVNKWINEWNHTPFIDVSENISIFKKMGVMQQIWSNMFCEPDTHIILLDDTVDNVIIHKAEWWDKKSKTMKSINNNILEFVNPLSL